MTSKLKTENSKLQTVGGPQGDEELRLWLENFIKEHPHLTTSVLEMDQHTGVSRTALDDYLAGTYFLPKESGGKGVDPRRSSIEKKLRDYREKVEGSVAANGNAIGFLETIAYRRFCNAWDAAVKENAIIVAYGDPGVGKTFNIAQLKVRRMTTMPISILCSRNVTVGYFAQRLAEELDLSPHHSIPRLEDMIATKLKKNPRGLIVDQANYLGERSLGTVCHVWEIAKIPILLSGTQDLYDLFTTSNMTQDVRAQLTSRVAMHYPLSKLTAAEAKAFLTRALGKDATDANIATVLRVTGGVFRSVNFIVPQIQRLKAMKKNSEDLATGKITMEHIIISAASRLMTAA
jgi:DNA transposition AAA+ family ATPase